MPTSSPLPRLAVARGVWGKPQPKGSIWLPGTGRPMLRRTEVEGRAEARRCFLKHKSNSLRVGPGMKGREQQGRWVSLRCAASGTGPDPTADPTTGLRGSLG